MSNSLKIDAQQTTEIVRMGLTGLGGYAGTACETLLQSDVCRLAAVFEPDYSAHPQLLERLKASGTILCNSYEQLLAQDIQAVWIPLPIHLHKPFTEQAVARGIAVLCEKPAAGTVQDLDAMIAARDRSGVPVAIAFQHLCDPSILTLKRQLVAGAFGEIQSISVTGCWPRSSSYYSRNNWAGRLRVGDTWVLDSPLANAMNHYLQLALYLGGVTVGGTAMPRRVEAELYRVNPIENFDTCSVRVQIDRDIPLLVLMTHACERNTTPTIHLRGSNGDVRIIPEDRIDMIRGEKSEMVGLGKNSREQLLRSFRDLVAETDEPTAAIATLEIAKAPLAVVNAVAMAAPVHTLLDSEFKVIVVDNGTVRAIPGIEAVFEACEQKNQMLYEYRVPWAVAPKSIDTLPPYTFLSPHG